MSQEPSSFSLPTAKEFRPIRSAAMRAVSSALSTPTPLIFNCMSWPWSSTCGARPGEKIRSLVFGAACSMDAMILAVGAGPVDSAAGTGVAGIVGSGMHAPSPAVRERGRHVVWSYTVWTMLRAWRSGGVRGCSQTISCTFLFLLSGSGGAGVFATKNAFICAGLGMARPDTLSLHLPFVERRTAQFSLTLYGTDMTETINPKSGVPQTRGSQAGGGSGTSGLGAHSRAASSRDTVLLSEVPDAAAVLVEEAVASAALSPSLSPAALAALGVRYEILAEAGHGSMGNVYKARDRETGETVALKLLKPEIASDQAMMDRFKNELLFARKITHK